MIRRKNGFTLMELMVYMAILGIIVIVAGRAFTDSTKFRVRTQNILKATQEVENVATLFKADASQMGAKSSKEAGDATDGSSFGDNFSSIYDDVYWDKASGDSSSFFIDTIPLNGQSVLYFRRARYDANGLYKAVEEICWFVDEGQVLKRSCRTVSGEAEEACPSRSADAARADAVEISTNVGLFQVVAPNPVTGAEEQIFPTPGNSFRLIPRTGDEHFFNFKSENDGKEEMGAGEEITLSQFYTNYDNAQGQLKSDHNNMNQAFAVISSGDAGSWKEYCQNLGLLTFQKGHTYEISFEIPFTNMSSDPNIPLQVFVPGEDHMSVGLRDINGNYLMDAAADPPKRMLDDFLFFPPYNSQGTGKRNMRFTVPTDVSGCIAFTFACYSPKASQAILKIKNLKVTEVPGLNYSFETAYNPEAHKADKQNIKALQLSLQITRGAGETGETIVVIPIPSNGPRD